MRTWKPFAFVSFFLALIISVGGLLVWNLPTLRADQESSQSPRALLHIARHPPRVLFSTAEPDHPQGDGIEDYNRYMNTQGALIRSHLVLNAAFQQPGVSQLPSIKKQADPIEWLKRNLEVSNIKDSELLQVSMSASSGASVRDQAAIVNAVVRAYKDEVADVDIKRRTKRHETLKKIKQSYAEVLQKRRDKLRELASTVGNDESLRGLAREALPRLYHDLRSQRVTLRLERAEAETLLARRKKAVGAATDPVRKEIDQIEDRLAVLIAREKVLDEELERVTRETRGDPHSTTLDLAETKDEIAQIEDASRKVGAEVEALNVELQAPPRIRLIVEATAPTR